MISLQTAKAYTSRVRSEFYGRVYKKEMGTLGWCKYAYVVINQWDEAVLLNEEQNQKVNELIHRIYSNEQEPLMYEAYKEGGITKEEYEEFQEDWKNSAEDRYFIFITGLEKILGFCPTKVTRIINKEESAF